MHILGMILFTLLVWTSEAGADCSGSGLTWRCTAGSTAAEVLSAYNSATDGATVTFDAGSYTFSSYVRILNTKGATFICATVKACTINYATAPAFYGDNFAGTNTRLYRFSGFIFDGGGTGYPTGAIWFNNDAGSPGAVMTQIRIDHNTFQNLATGRYAIFFGSSVGRANYYGVIDHNLFTNAAQFTPLIYTGLPIPSPPPNPLGTGNNLFFEDNTINFTTLPNASAGGCIDGWGGAAFVLRHNTSLNCLWALHGVLHGGGPANVEFYDNETRLDAGSSGSGVESCYRCFHHQGSGTFVAFNNSFTAYSGKAGEVISMLHYRDFPETSPPAFGQCDGTQTRDGNRQPIETYRGYPCWHQPGRDFHANLSPLYVWNNYWSDTLIQVPMTVPTRASGSLNYHANHMQANRDWYNAVSANAQTSTSTPFNGTTGMGFGTKVNRPTTCTTNASESGGGVGYFATDEGPQGTLYRCSATNTWTLHYQPYTYPHPLQTGGGGIPPRPSAPPPGNLRIQ